MKALGIGMFIIGYALFYSGASNLFTGGQGWGFLQALLNKGTANQLGSKESKPAGSAGTAVGKSLQDLLGNIFAENNVQPPFPGGK